MRPAINVTRAQLEALGELAKQSPRATDLVIETTNLHRGSAIAVVSGGDSPGHTWVIAANGKTIEL